MNIEELIRQGREQEAAWRAKDAEEATRQREVVRKQVEDRAAQIRSALGEVWAELESYASLTANANGDQARQVWYVVDKPGLEKFCVVSEKEGATIVMRRNDSSNPVRLDRGGTEGIAGFLWERRKEWERAEGRRQESALRNAQSVEDARKALEILRRLAPGQVEDWEELFEARKGMLEYAGACRAARREQAAAMERNRGRLGELQRSLDTPIQLWAVRYRAMGEEEDDFRTETVYALNSDPDWEGFWRVLENMRERRIRYSNVISVEGPIETKPTEGFSDCMAQRYVPEASAGVGNPLFFLPAEEKNVEAMLEELMEKLPSQPAAPDGLEPWEAERIWESR